VLANLRNLAVAEIRAATDGLTGLPNKRATTDAMNRTFAQATMTKSPLGLLLLDLDHFKQVNDQYGHAAGDQVLASVGAALRRVLRERDFAGRNGGEEFAVLLPDADTTAALEIAERIRSAIAEITLPGTDVPVTASIGVAGFPRHASTLDRLERLADAALYVAKRQGRNRVELASTDAPADSPAPSAADSVPVPVPREALTLSAGQLQRAPTPGSATPGSATPGSARPTGRGRSAARAWSAGSRPRPSRPSRDGRRWSAPPS
jgi:diguanylate cyclase (GGDEF)-like protein